MRGYFDASSVYCNTTLHSYVYNLTSSYTDQSNEGIMAATSATMFLLAALFFNLNLFSRFTDVSTFLDPSIRLFLKVSLAIFLPVMSYLFSEAKGSVATTGEMGELSLRARTILTWMLLVELLYKKVEAILSTRDGAEGYSGIIERAARIAWLGYLVFFNLRSIGKRALYGSLWVLVAAKLVQRFVTSELGKRSFAYGRNPQLLASYMAQILRREDQPPEDTSHQSPLLKQCRYAVMGEECLEKRPTSEGYQFEADDDDNAVVVTIGGIWRLADKEKDDDSQRNRRNLPVVIGSICWLANKKEDLLLGRAPLKRLCLSFALYKLLRRRLEDFPITADEARNCHNLIFKGLCEEDTIMKEGDPKQGEEGKAVALFQVLNDEVQFLCEYYHSIHPVQFASPFFFLINYIMFPIVVWASCILLVILCNNGDVSYAFSSLRTDNDPLTVGILKMTGCLLSRVTKSPPDFFSTVDISVTILLVITFVYEEVWEVIVFLLSNWFTVSLLCSYTSKPQWRRGWFITRAIRCILWVRTKLSRPNVCFKQFSMLRPCRISQLTKAVPIEAKVSIMQRLAIAREVAPACCNGISSSRLLAGSDHEHLLLGRQNNNELVLSWACEGDGGIADIILTWHIATALLEASHPVVQKREPNLKAATMLSMYCAYLVAFRPELLPGDKDATERVYKDMKSELKKEIGCWGYYFCRQGKLMELASRREAPEPEPERERTTTTALRKGTRLGKILIDEYSKDEAAPARVWKLLADLWTEVMVCAAPAVSEVHVKAHKEALAHGGEFITMLWALATHTGIVHGPPHHQRV